VVVFVVVLVLEVLLVLEVVLVEARVRELVVGAGRALTTELQIA